MHLQTILSTLGIAEKHMTPAKYALFVRDMRIAYISSEISTKESYLALKVKNAAIAREYQAALPVLKAQLAAL